MIENFATGNGISVNSVPNVAIYCDYIGTDFTGNAKASNGLDGILIAGNSPGTTIGASSAPSPLIVGGNLQNGIEIKTTVSGTTILDTNVGIGADGKTAVANSLDGILVNNAPGVTIGPRNVISANLQNGVDIVGDPASKTIVRASLIGTDSLGTLARGNARDGILITNASHVTIGGAAPADLNVISANKGNGIETVGSTVTGTLITGDYIGTTLDGKLALGNGGWGVSIGGGTANTIGSTAASPTFLISANSLGGVALGSSMSAIVNGYLGTAIDGKTALGNIGDGVLVTAKNNTLTGLVISANTGNGVNVTGASVTGTVIQKSFIGTTFDGLTPLGNSLTGIILGSGASAATIGGSAAGAGNVISANSAGGIAISGAATVSGSLVEGNTIGANVNGLGGSIFGNTGNGVVISGVPGNTVSGNLVAHNTANGIEAAGNSLDRFLNNTVTANTLAGIFLNVTLASTISGNSITGNLGDGVTVADGVLDLVASNTITGNGAEGVDFSGTTSSTISGNGVSTNGADGVLIAGGGGNLISGNGISTNGFDGLGIVSSPSNTATVNTISDNGGIGVSLNSASTNTIGGSAAGLGNLITGNASRGVQVVGGSANLFLANTIGGAGAAANGSDGVYLGVTTSGNTIGAGNLISGNKGNGIQIESTGSANLIIGALIGTTADGKSALGNSINGVLVFGPNNTIGAGTVISGNKANGVQIDGLNGSPASTANGNILTGVLIGLNQAGTAAIPNGGNGVLILNSASGNVVDSSVISGNSLNGVAIVGYQTTGNIVDKTYLGTSADGKSAIGNGGDGVLLQDSNGNIIGSGDVISANAGNGVEISGSLASANLVTGALIGTDVSGLKPLGNAGNGVLVTNSASFTTISATTTSANKLNGVALVGTATTSNVLFSDKIGVTSDGKASLGNGGLGLLLDGSHQNTIGGATSDTVNQVSGNSLGGVLVTGLTAFGNVFPGNLIGTDVTGKLVLPGDSGDGLTISNAPRNTVGQGNVISGYLGNGLVITGASATGNLVTGVLIGTDQAGTVALGNSLDGAVIGGGASGNTITLSVISANKGDGLAIVGGSSGNLVTKSYIGTMSSGFGALGNGGLGVRIDSSAKNTIGGASVGGVIAANGSGGVLIHGAAASGNLIEGYYVGTDASGIASPVAPRLNPGNGITVSSAPNTTIRGDVIGAFAGSGIALTGPGTTATLIVGDQIGTDRFGLSSALGNAVDGVLITGGAAATTIGGSATADRNVIVKNGNGIEVTGAGSGTLIQGNDVGVGADGFLILSNVNGVVAVDSPDVAVIGNVISGNGTGLSVLGITGTVDVRGNLIGVDSTGAKARGNGQGVVIASSNGVHLGGPADSDRNVISGSNLGAGGSFANPVGVTLTSDPGALVQNNNIGTDSTGEVAIGNGDFGLALLAMDHATITGNVISANLEGIRADTLTVSLLTDNKIGTDAKGTAALGNTLDGIELIRSADNTIGAGNIVSANGLDGIAIEGPDSGNDSGPSTGNLISGVKVGTDASGAAPLGNAGNGVILIGGGSHGTVILNSLVAANRQNGVAIVDGAPLNVVIGSTIGAGTTDAAGTLGNGLDGVRIASGAHDNLILQSVISGNAGDGVGIADQETSNNLILNSKIGTDPTGTAAVPNGGSGVLIQDAGFNQVGPNNQISGNRFHGVAVVGATAGANAITGNVIGMTADLTHALPNGQVGVLLSDAQFTIIGGAYGNGGNFISGNAGGGIALYNGSGDTQIFGNVIGMGADGNIPAGTVTNGAVPGILISDSHSTTVGGLLGSTGNVISRNTGDGIDVFGSASAATAILGNFIGTLPGGGGAAPNGLVVTQASGPLKGVGLAEGDGVLVVGASGVTIGGSGSAGNVISGNLKNGVEFQSAASAVVQGNKIGTDASGTIRIANGLPFGPGSRMELADSGGVIDSEFLNDAGGNPVSLKNAYSNGVLVVDSPGATIGGAGGLGNVLSGNGSNGLVLQGSGTSGASVGGNVIGLAAGGSVPSVSLGNYGDGILIDGSGKNAIGAPGSGNIIAANGFTRSTTFPTTSDLTAGVFLQGQGASGNVLRGNTIGSDASGTTRAPCPITWSIRSAWWPRPAASAASSSRPACSSWMPRRTRSAASSGRRAT